MPELLPMPPRWCSAALLLPASGIYIYRFRDDTQNAVVVSALQSRWLP